MKQLRRRYLPALGLALLLGPAACTSAPLHRDHPHPDPRIKGVISQDKVEPPPKV